MKQTRIPFAMNRWVQFVIAFIIVMFHGALIMNWTPLRNIFTRDKAYAWRCKPGDALDEDGTCGSQRVALALIGNLGQTFMFVGSFIAGVICDIWGPKIVATSGGILFSLSWLFAAVSSQKAQLYIPFAILDGLAIEMSFFGVLTVPNLFPRHRQFMLSMLGTARSMAMFFPLTLDKVNGGYKPVFITAMCISLAITLLSFLGLPMKPYQVIQKEEQPSIENDPPDIEKEPVCEGESAHTSQDVEYEAPDFKTSALLFLRAGRKPFYIAWVVAFCLLYSRGAFYGISLVDQHKRASEIYSYLSPVSFVPCPFLGLAADYFGMIAVLTFLNTCGVIVFACLLSGTSLAAQWIAVLLMTIVLSFLGSQNYCWVQENYDELTRGKLSGFAMLAAGLFSLVNTPLYAWATDAETFIGPNWLFMGAGFVIYALVGFLYIVRRRKTVKDKPVEIPRKEISEQSIVA